MLPLLVALVCLAFAFGAASTAGASSAPRPAMPKPTPVPYDWQSFGHDGSHDAYVNTHAMNAAVAPKLGALWMTNVLSPDLGSPSIAYNPALNATLVFVSDQRGNVSAMSEATGQNVWTTSLGAGAAVSGTPLVSADQSSVWVGTTAAPRLYKLNSATGAIECSVAEPSAVVASPTEGLTSVGAYVVYVPTAPTATQAGLMSAYNESDCSRSFSTTPFLTSTATAIASPAYGVDATGRQLIFEGTTHPDSTEYAIDATTGALDWSFVVDSTGVADIAASATVSPPGTNGFADGVVYVVAGNQTCYALDLTTGALIWQYDFGADAGTTGGLAKSGAALDGNTLIFGMVDGAYALDATTGAKLWRFVDSAKREVISNPAIVGPPGNEVVAFGDLSGEFHVLRMSDGRELYHTQTGNYIFGSPAFYGNSFFFTSTDGFLYAYEAAGGTGGAPKTAVTTPHQNSTVAYASSITISGTSSDPIGVGGAEVAVQTGGPNGLWYDAAANAWVAGAVTNTVPVATPGAASSSWSLTIPITSATGSTFHVVANAVDVDAQTDVRGATVNFAVGGSSTTPSVQAAGTFIAPGTMFAATAANFAAGESIGFSINGAAIGSATADASGDASATLKLPAASAFGPLLLTATGATSGGVATAPIFVENAWLQSGDGPLHHGFEANDSAFSQISSPGSNTFLGEAWYYPTGVPVEASPAIFGGTLFFGDDSGTMTALPVDSLVPNWTYTIPKKTSIRSTPAIDSQADNVIFTSDDGKMYVMKTGSGDALYPPVYLGGMLTSPTLSNSRIFIGSDSGNISAVNESTGAVIWTHKLHGPVHSTPVLDWTTRVVVVGDDKGYVTAFLSSTGLQLWQYQTFGPVTVPPTIVNGTVYVGSADQHLYAIDEAYGTHIWSYSAGSPITTNAVEDPTLGYLYIGLANGRLAAVNIATGALAWSTFVPSPYMASSYTGLGAASSIVFGENSGGSLTAFDTATAGGFDLDLPTQKGLSSAPVLNDGTVYVAANDGGVYAYTPYGRLPQSVPGTIRRAAARAASARTQHPLGAGSAAPGRPFAWNGRHDYPVHIDGLTRPASGALRYHGGRVQTAPRTYVVLWRPTSDAFDANYLAGVIGAFGTVSGAYVESAPYPALIGDAEIQTEISRAIAVNHWRVDPNASFVLFTGSGAIDGTANFCSYHGAFALGGNHMLPVVYAVIPYLGSAGACATATVMTRTGDPAVDSARANIARVRRELVNDPLFDGWYDERGGETGAGY